MIGDEIVAVHCKTGLSRTATVIGTHLRRNCHFSAAEAIAWIRLCRPGSVVWNDQRFLAKYDQTLNRGDELFVQIATAPKSNGRRHPDRPERKNMSAAAKGNCIGCCPVGKSASK
jgi:cell division cycle 14